MTMTSASQRLKVLAIELHHYLQVIIIKIVGKLVCVCLVYFTLFIFFFLIFMFFFFVGRGLKL